MITEAYQEYSGAVLAGAELESEIARLRKSSRNAQSITGAILGLMNSALPRRRTSANCATEVDSSEPSSSQG